MKRKPNYLYNEELIQENSNKISDKCVMCNKDKVFTSVFVPGEKLAFAPKGKTRMLQYNVCREHIGEQYREELESKIISIYKVSEALRQLLE